MNPISNMKRQPWYKWVIVAICFLMVMVCLGFCSGIKSLYLSAITEALGIKRSLFSFNDSSRYVTTAVINLFFGTLVLRMGPRKMIAIGFASLIASMLVYSFAESIYIFCIGGVLLGLGLAFTTTTMVGYVVNHWCKENKGTIMGAILAANGLGGAVASQVVSPIINSGVFGYRTSYQVTALILLVVAAIVVFLFKDTPEGVELEAQGKKKAKGDSWTGLSLKECLRKPWFYVASLCVFLTGLVLQGSNGVYPAHMRDVGMDPAFVATVVSIHSLCLTASKFLTGVSYDKLGLRITMIICDIAGVVMIFLISIITAGASTFAVFVGILSAVALPLETIMLPLITADLFGQKDYAKILGIMVAVNTAGYAVGAPTVNLFYDMQGTYKQILVILCCVMAAVAVIFQLVLTVAHRQRKLVMAQEEK